MYNFTMDELGREKKRGEKGAQIKKEREVKNQ